MYEKFSNGGYIITLKKLSIQTGYSVSTISKVLSGSDEIKGETADIIWKAAKESGYISQKDKRKRDIFQSIKDFHPIIAVIVPEFSSTYYMGILSKLEAKIKQMGGIMSVSIGNFSAVDEQRLIQYYNSIFSIDAIILISSELNLPFDELQLQIPLILLGCANHNYAFDSVNIDFERSINDAIVHLKNLGHTEIGFIGESLTKVKYDCFAKAIAQNSLVLCEDYIRINDKRHEEAGYIAMQSMFANGKLPTAILAAYDFIAFGAIRAINEHGLSVPLDISIIGMDDITISSYLKTPLSSIRTFTNDLCEITLSILKRKIEDKNFKTIQSIGIQSELIIRATTSKKQICEEDSY